MKMLFALAVALAVASPATAGYHYTTVDGPSSASLLGTVVTSINDAGLAAGYYVNDDGVGGPGNYTAFTVNKDGSGFYSFSRPGYAQTGAAGIDNAGDVTGVSVTSLGHGTGFVRSGADGSYADIDPNLDPTFGVTSLYSEAIGLNNLGAVTGYYTTDPAATVGTLAQYAHGFIEFGGVYTAVDVDPLDGYGTQVTSINDLGLFTGTYLDNSADHFSHPFLGVFAPGAGAAIIALDTDPFGAPSSSIGNITDNFYSTYNSLYPCACSPTGFASAAYVLDVAFGGYEPIAVPGAFFTNVFGINQSTDVTGYYLDPTGLHGFVASWVPEPASWLMMIAGFGLTGVMLRRRERGFAQGFVARG
ncbi:PEPxxWA-CTERM sorting domain-containing protein [Polymorphobacter sp. PAMC 29334]|uniref:PEPxxWA-CTERM sorting domain-containing protein n=1 Tax=Polymorphobacter sp. PAMC 29334 TaxID=2862331 RepID=UPI001D00B273|nr:PEPxxWA-CTERM sorting domain-containing protein [Polymorphobacter sp. PAMC 29334]